MRVKEVIANLQPLLDKHVTSQNLDVLSPPKYAPDDTISSANIALGVRSANYCMSDEAYQLMLGLDYADYLICGHNWPCMDLTDVKKIMSIVHPTTCIVQDKREWEGKTFGRGFDEREKFINTHWLKHCHSTFKLTVLKDAHQRQAYHRDSAEEIGCHAWITYYHPEIVCAVAPFVRKEHIVRTYHTLDGLAAPPYKPDNRRGALLSGAMNDAYPWRQRLLKSIGDLNTVYYLPHPGYTRGRCYTADYLTELSKYKVAICTSSMYGYALRKIIEATAAGCIVITDLPEDEVLPYIDGNLIRVDPTISNRALNATLAQLYTDYSPSLQYEYAERAKKHYDYRAMGERLAKDINTMRQRYLLEQK